MNEIYRKIPHRPPFLFIDRIVEIGEHGAVAERKIRSDEPQFEGHYPENPIMPGVLLCEAVFQTGGVYLAHRMDRDSHPMEGGIPILSRIQEAKFKNLVRPGDKITIEVEFKETILKFHFFSGKIRRGDGKLVLTIDFVLALLPSEDRG